MAALTPTTVVEIETGINQLLYGTTDRRVRRILVEATTTAADNTTDLSTYVDDLTGILAIEAQAIDGATAATSATWSSTTVTWAGHTGSGVTKAVFLCY